MAFERIWENISRSLSQKAKSTNFMPARTSKKVEILSQGKYFWGPSMLNSNRAVFEVVGIELYNLHQYYYYYYQSDKRVVIDLSVLCLLTYIHSILLL